MTTIRRAFLAVAMLALAWAAVVAATGGVGLSVAGIRFSSRNLRNPLLLALVTAGTAVALARGNRHRALADDLRSLRALVVSAANVRWRRVLARVPAAAAAFGAVLLILDWARARPLWLDEEMIALNVRDRGMAELAGPLWLNQTAPLGWLAGERVALVVLGQSEPALRAIPVAFGIATLAAAAWIGRRWLGAVAATTLVLLLALGRWIFHNALELKPYSADALFGLLLPAVAVWATEGGEPGVRRRRAAIWWCAAAVGLWWSNGALFVAPACALLLAAVLWRVDGLRSAGIFAACGAVWLVSAGVHYLAALRFARDNDVLVDMWSFALPPAAAGIAERIAWGVGRAVPLTANPVGTDLTVLFWGAALAGMLAGRPRLMGYAAAAVVLSAPALAAVRLVPLYERLSLWIVPALYVAIALCVNAAIRWVHEATAAHRWVPAAAAAVAALVVLRLPVDIAAEGWLEVGDAPRRVSNHQLDDRAGVRWLLAERRPGDVVITTPLALPAVWWYGGIPLGPPGYGTTLPDGTPIVEVSYGQPGACDAAALPAALAARTRALVYFGFRFDDVPAGFDDLLLGELQRIGRISESRAFAGITRAVIVDLHDPVQRAASPPARGPARLEGCISVTPARRW